MGQNKLASGSVVATVSVYYVALAILFLIALFFLWPGMKMLARIDELPSDVRILLLALAAAGLGSIINATTSFADFVGNRSLAPSWILWFLFRPLIGMSTGMVVYAALRGGILKADSAVDVLNPYAVVTVAAVAGFLSKHIVDKLNYYASERFRTGANEYRRDELVPPPPPQISAVMPREGPMSGGTEVVITGTGFASGVDVFFDDEPASSVENDQARITATSPAFSEETRVNLAVINPDGQKSVLLRAYQYLRRDE
jgi:hypothetical protein